MSEIVYPLEEFTGERQTNFIRPDNYKIPDFCNDCPLMQNCNNPRISVARSAEVPVNTDGVRHLNSFGPHSALILSDSAEASDFEPVYIGTQRIVSPFSMEHESPESEVLGYANQAVDKCTGSVTKKRIFRSDLRICNSGLVKISNFHNPGYRLRVDEEGLANPYTLVVPRP